MATNLRLRPETEEALRLEAERTGRSQQEIIREALDLHLGLREPGSYRTRGIQDLTAVYDVGRSEAPPDSYRMPSTVQRKETGAMDELTALLATGALLPPRTPFRTATRRLRLPPGVTTAALMDREDRL